MLLQTDHAPEAPATDRSTVALLGLGTAVPKRRYTQEEIYELTCLHSEIYRSPRVRQIFMNSDIHHRYLYLDPEVFRWGESVGQLHDRYATGALDIGSEAARKAIASAGLGAADIDCIFAVSCTGYLCPGLTSLIGKEIGLRTDIQRGDLVGMGCAGAVPGLQRASDFVRANPGKRALVVAAEICSACYFFDETMDTIIGNAICSDGAAAVVVGPADIDEESVAGRGGAGRNGALHYPRIAGFGSALAPDQMDKVGFDHREGRLRIILAREVRDLAGQLASELIDTLLRRFELPKDAIDHWVLHPGGRKVIDAVRSAAGLSEEQVRGTTHVLRNYGNMSSPTVLFVLDHLLREADPALAPKPGDTGILLALGPGMAAEAALLKW